MNLHTLTKLRSAAKQRDGAEGTLFLHQWPTGFQEVIFATETLADQFLIKLNKGEEQKPTATETE